MSAYEHFKETIGYHTEKGNTNFTYSTKAAGNMISEIDNRLRAIEKLQDILESVPLHVGDVVHEAGYPEEKGDIIEVTENEHETIYRVTIRHRRRTIVYYRDELTLMERPPA